MEKGLQLAVAKEVISNGSIIQFIECIGGNG
jgi:hypothetical protein